MGLMGLTKKPEPVMIAGLATALATLGGVYGLDLTVDQIAGFISVLAVLFNLIARQQVRPIEKK